MTLALKEMTWTFPRTYPRAGTIRSTVGLEGTGRPTPAQHLDPENRADIRNNYVFDSNVERQVLLTSTPASTPEEVSLWSSALEDCPARLAL
jgi:hypothetical protein